MGAGATLAASLVPGLGASMRQADTSGLFIAGLTGDQESDPVDTTATGGALFTLSPDGTEVYYTVVVSDMEDLVQGHIHRGAPGESGDVVVWLYPSPLARSGQLIPGRTDGVIVDGTITRADLLGPLSGEPLSALVDLHTRQNPGGEIRGQILTLDDVVACVAAGQTTEATTEVTTEAPTGATTEAPTETPTTEAGTTEAAPTEAETTEATTGATTEAAADR